MPVGRVSASILHELQSAGALSPDKIEEIHQRPEELNGEQLDNLLRSEYGVKDFQLLTAKAHMVDMMPLPVDNFRVTSDLFEILPRKYCQENNILPLGVVGDYILVAFANPFEVGLNDAIEEKSGLKLVRYLSPPEAIHVLVAKDEDSEKVHFDDVIEEIDDEYADEEIEEDLDSDDVDEESGPIIRLANRIIEDAYYLGTSDIHVEPGEKELMVRYRVDGNLQEKLRLPMKVAGALIARYKIMCNLDIAERRLPQDGRIIFKNYTKRKMNIDLRVSTAPLNFGEGVVMRILDKEKSTLPLPALGFSEANLKKYREVILQPYGMILHCGPTGSGKSMTLYSALNEINSPEINIRTAEDPIEYTLGGINQMQMNRQIGLTFANALRAYLRQDPDIILVGEIRDRETANIAVEAALTGHLLLSTLHTNDAPGTIARLTDMGIEPFMISSSLLCVCAQRLMRRVCKKCRISMQAEGRAKELLEDSIGWSGSIFRPRKKGCDNCNGTGYKGRVGIHELMTVSNELVEGINKGLETAELKKIAMTDGMMTLHQDSMLKVKEGITTIEESLATVPPDL
ncbi:MAG: type II/IV secretion system protein [Opitutales bacterium]|nr:type II/IV secretion system protein [Opitutales bacterium]MCH8540826.1 GspE/PulE family protein [Opitutales bacterium]